MNRKWMIRLGLAFVLLVGVGLGVFLVREYLAKERDKQLLKDLMQKLDASDPGWRLEDIERAHNAKVAPAHENLATQSLAILKTLPQSYKDYNKDTSAKIIPQIEIEDHRLPHDDAFCSLHELMLDLRPEVQALLQASQLPQGGIAVNYNWKLVINTLLQDVQEMRELAWLLHLYSFHQAYFGNGDEALRASHAIFRFAELGLQDHPFAVSQMVRVALLAISTGNTQQTLAWTTAQTELEPLQKSYLAAANSQCLIAGIRGDRAMYHHLVNQVRSGQAPVSSLFDLNTKLSPIQQKLESWKLGSRLIVEQAFMLEVFTQQIEAAKLNGLARQAAFAQATAYRDSRPDMMLAKVFTNWTDKSYQTDDRIQAQLRTAAVGIACERFRMKEGRWPVTLAEIPKSILADIPLDPYTDKPLLYAKLPDGIVVYTTGPDGTDDGGTNLSFQDVGPRDIGFRLYDLNARRRPALPRPEVIVVDEDLPDMP